MKDQQHFDKGDYRELFRFYLIDHNTLIGKTVDITLLSLNLLFVGVFILDTYPIGSDLKFLLWNIELIISFLFLIEYILRIYSAESRISEFLNIYTMIDLISILPILLIFILPVPIGLLNIGFLRVIRIVRLLRFYRFTQDAEFFFGTVSDNTLRVTKLVLTMFVLLSTSAGLFYTAEHIVNPKINTFGDAFYYTVVTLSTVGFGDILPHTQAGRWITVGSIIAAIIIIPRQASKIIREWTYSNKVNVTCQNCGLSYHDEDASHCKACGNIIYQEYDSRQ